MRIIYRENEFVIFDFRAFAFVVMRDRRGTDVCAYPPEHYNCCFKDLLELSNLPICCKETWIILPRDYKEALQIAIASRERSVVGPARKFLGKLFPEHYRLLVK